MALIGQIGCIWARWLYLGKMVIFGQKVFVSLKMVLFGQTGSIWARCMYLGKMWLYLGKRCLYLGKMVLFGQVSFILSKGGCIWGKWFY